ncbi:MAG: alpha/beta hydrolase [Hyphomonadaceae bacterium]|nr:MAG: alpha/beta hydrolase [Caulobacteraceae bacterium]MBT9444240.1 alpha/beta hydrolase [Hyphomonadaceae bacterium]TPW06150.1 MAG: alpha/beta hydrolase [Alphaproteobacteria bacterium]
MASEHIVRSTDGLGLFVRDYAPLQPALGLPVLCLHGLTRNSADFEIVAPRIAALGRRAIAMDVRGRGRSDWDGTPSRYTPLIYAQDALKVLDQLGVARAVWLGTSMGGLITMIAAAMAPDRVEAAILNDIGPVIDPRGLARIATYVGKSEPRSTWDEAAAAVAMTQSVAFPDADAAFWHTFARRTYRKRADGRLELDYDPAIAQPQPDLAPDLRPVFKALQPIPTLVLRGGVSDILSREGVAEMRALKGDLEVSEVPNVGHAPTLEEPGAWLPIVDFLARVA